MKYSMFKHNEFFKAVELEHLSPGAGWSYAKLYFHCVEQGGFKDRLDHIKYICHHGNTREMTRWWQEIQEAKLFNLQDGLWTISLDFSFLQEPRKSGNEEVRSGNDGATVGDEEVRSGNGATLTSTIADPPPTDKKDKEIKMNEESGGSLIKEAINDPPLTSLDSKAKLSLAGRITWLLQEWSKCCEKHSNLGKKWVLETADQAILEKQERDIPDLWGHYEAMFYCVKDVPVWPEPGKQWKPQFLNFVRKNVTLLEYSKRGKAAMAASAP